MGCEMNVVADVRMGVGVDANGVLQTHGSHGVGNSVGLVDGDRDGS